jgi:hypothetical protein
MITGRTQNDSLGNLERASARLRPSSFCHERRRNEGATQADAARTGHHLECGQVTSVTADWSLPDWAGGREESHLSARHQHN